MKNEKMYTAAEAKRIELMRTFYELEHNIKRAKKAGDYRDVLQKTGFLAEALATVMCKLTESGETLNPMDEKMLEEIRERA